MAFPSTFANLQASIISRLNLDATADLAATKDCINQAYSEVCIETEAIQTSNTITLTPGTASYTLSSFLTNAIVRIKAMSITYGGVTYPPLTMIDLDPLLRRRVGAGGTAVATGTATHYAVDGMTTLELYPTPLSADTLTVWYVAQPTALSGDSDVPAIPEPYATRCLIAGGAWQMSDTTGDPGGPSYGQDFELWKQKFRAHLNRRRGAQPGQFVWFPGGPNVPHDPATIYSGDWR